MSRMTDLIVAWRNGTRIVKAAIVVSGAMTAIGFITGLITVVVPLRALNAAALAIAMVGAVGLTAISTILKSLEEVREERKIEAVEKRVQENPRESQVAWELARVKLESYLNRNLSQVRSIFWLTLFVMVAGFLLIGVGVGEAYSNTANLQASMLAAGSGVIVNFIGGTFLIIYKATMAQAKDYVTILERINAVGMSVQILENIKNQDGDLKDKTTAEVAMQLLMMYSHDVKNRVAIKPPRRLKRRVNS
jgi:hypothetical protein